MMTPFAAVSAASSSGSSAGGELAAAEVDALGTRARLVLWPAEGLRTASLAVWAELCRLDKEASRFRHDSEVSRLCARGGGLFFVGEGLAEVVAVALAAARFTGGLVDPTVGNALVGLGYDRDFASLTIQSDVEAHLPGPAPGFQSVGLTGRLLRLPAGVLLDLGATAKGLGSDRAARSAFQACGEPGGVLVSLGGDIAVAGEPPAGGWPLLISEAANGGDDSPTQMVRLEAGAVATSSTRLRRWQRAGRDVHHIIDPRTGLPAEGPWRTVTVGAASCAEANAASTAALVAGDDAVTWLESKRLPGRLVAVDGTIRCVGPWPATEGGLLVVPAARMGDPAREHFGVWR